MAVTFNRIATATGWLLFIALVIYVFCGCTVKLKDQGNVFLRFGTEIAVGHETSKTEAESKAETDIDKGLKNWMWDDDENQQTIENPDLSDPG